MSVRSILQVTLTLTFAAVVSACTALPDARLSTGTAGTDARGIAVEPRADRPRVIAHRGASGYLPEHTLAAYAYAHALGADLIEPDLVMTRDGVLVARHEPRLDETTDVAERFPDRRAPDGHYYAADLDWAELSTLRVVEYRPDRFPRASRIFGVPRLEDIIELVSGLNSSTGREVGLYPELKAPAWHAERGLDPVAALRRVLERTPFEGVLYIQSFEAPPLEALARAPIPGAQLVLLIEDPALLADAELARAATFADAIGPSISDLTRARRSGDDVVARAHAAGLSVDAWTLRADALGAFGDVREATCFVVDLGVDGIFTDHPDQVLAALGVRGAAPGPIDDERIQSIEGETPESCVR